jgi:Ca2+-binding RTX toxin-like protein
MARVKLYIATDMVNVERQVGDVYYSDSKLLVITTLDSNTYYYGSFSYPNGVWKGTITSALSYDKFGYLTSAVTGLRLDTKYATAGPAALNAYAVALAYSDNIDGSNYSDKLRGYAGNDTILGRSGNDAVLGEQGNDRIYAGSGQDAVFGGLGHDSLAGGVGNDVLVGGPGADHFIFSLYEGRDRVRDFQDGVDRIEISAGADGFSDVRIAQTALGAQISFDDAVVLLEGISADSLSANDFVFT